jgi:hypothetical protein
VAQRLEPPEHLEPILSLMDQGPLAPDHQSDVLAGLASRGLAILHLPSLGLEQPSAWRQSIEVVNGGISLPRQLSIQAVDKKSGRLFSWRKFLAETS